MSINRIQKLLFSEYCDFEDMVLVESPFAQTTREGKGLRQVQLGLTPSKLVLATDILQTAELSPVTYIPGLDPEIETFELVAVYPLECVNISVFHRRSRQSLKAHFCNNRIYYFELGGFEKRHMFWNLWCEKVRFLNPEEPGSSNSESSAATSNTNSTLYLVSSRQIINETGTTQLWWKFGAGDYTATNSFRWTDRYLFLGSRDENPLQYNPLTRSPTLAEFLHKDVDRIDIASKQSPETPTKTSSQVNRFGLGVMENCRSCLFLPAENYIVTNKFSNHTTQSTDVFTMYKSLREQTQANMLKLAENSVKQWEFCNCNDPISETKIKGRHRRRYGFSPQPYFLHGLGPWNVSPGARYSVQTKRAVSLVNIRRQPLEPELRLPVSKRQLVASISHEDVRLDDKLFPNNNILKSSNKSPVIFFWTPEYWYRPRSARDAYLELQTHLSKIREFRKLNIKKSPKSARKKFLRKKKRQEREILRSDSEDSFERIMHTPTKRKRQSKVSAFTKTHELLKVLPFLCLFSCIDEDKPPEETSLQFLKRVLRLEVSLTAWDFDSSTLAYQLTLIDRDLFLKIPPTELGVLIWQQSSKNAPNVGALIAFSHRISCLVATEVLRDDSEKIRARLVARFINTAEKCNKIANFQSCRSVLCGLQSPPIYRLYSTWTYVRKKHATKYQVFEKLCRLYRDPRLPAYQKSFHRATQNHQYLPYIGDIITKLLDRIPEYNDNLISCCKVPPQPCIQTKVGDAEISSNLFRKILTSFSRWSTEDKSNKERHNTSTVLTKETPKRTAKGLTDYYKPLNCYEDNRYTRLREAVELLTKYQRAAANFMFSRNELATEYLLKARYREDRENFFNSFNVEPPIT
ncbi:uncharacterized protein [Onthophagus taurus]|uniref:uncharacterized protein isoform X1 n=1 Tax=Onthophagus taurus TaxID=166361 RepID=UPI0039BE7BFD